MQGIPNVVVYLDDILVTGTDDQEHLKYLGAVLERLQSHGLRLKRCKGQFMQSSVEYLGYNVTVLQLNRIRTEYCRGEGEGGHGSTKAKECD